MEIDAEKGLTDAGLKAVPTRMPIWTRKTRRKGGKGGRPKVVRANKNVNEIRLLKLCYSL